MGNKDKGGSKAVKKAAKANLKEKRKAKKAKKTPDLGTHITPQ